MAEMHQGVQAALDNTRELSIDEVGKLKAATGLAQTTIERLKVAEGFVERQTVRALAEVVASVQPELVKALRTMAVVEERRWNLRQNIIGVVGVSCLLMGVYGTGYVMGGGDMRSRSEGRAASAAVDRCFKAAEEAAKENKSGKDQAFSCPMTTLDGMKL